MIFDLINRAAIKQNCIEVLNQHCQHYYYYCRLRCSDGQKMSKRKKNYPDPMDIVSKYGADAIR